jgi:hypothetical protein
MLVKSGEMMSMKEIARREGVDDSCVSCMVNRTNLTPGIGAVAGGDAVRAGSGDGGTLGEAAGKG